MVNDDSVRMRSSPGLSDSVVKTLARDTRVLIIGFKPVWETASAWEGYWVHIRAFSTSEIVVDEKLDWQHAPEGWVFSPFLDSYLHYYDGP